MPRSAAGGDGSAIAAAIGDTEASDGGGGRTDGRRSAEGGLGGGLTLESLMLMSVYIHSSCRPWTRTPICPRDTTGTASNFVKPPTLTMTGSSTAAGSRNTCPA